MAQTLTAKEKALNHEDGQGIIEALVGIKSALVTSGIHARKIYSFHYNGAESNPANIIEYMDDAIGMTPSKMNLSTGVFNWGSWRNAFFMPRPCMVGYDGKRKYYLMEDNYALKEDGTASDIADDTFEGNAMMEWGRDGQLIWLKVVPDSDPKSGTVSIANYQADDDFHAWNFYDKDNVLKDHFYTPIYQGSIDSNGRLRSLSGKVHCKNKTAQAEMDAAALNGDRWTIETWADRTLISFLLMLIGKSTAVQETFGLGHSTDSWTESHMLESGTMNDKGLFFGTSNSGEGGDGVKVFGMENWWGDQWRRTCGMINNNGVISYKMTRGTADGSTATDYNTTASGYKTISGKTFSGTSGGYISEVLFTDDSMIPVTASGSDSTYLPDGLWFNNGQLDFALCGAALHYGRLVGLALLVYAAPAHASWDVGAAVSCR